LNSKDRFADLWQSASIYLFANLAFKPWSYKAMVAGDQSRVVKASYAIMGVLLVSALVWILILYNAFDLIVGSEVSSSRSAAMVMVISSLFVGFYLLVVKDILFAERARFLMWLTVPLSAVYCILVFQLDAVIDVAHLNLGYHVLIFLVVWFAACRIYPQPWFNLLGVRR
tara:strand:- start:2454 stop:2963 length:510 start_codon:yes stop_codon:yes gene_type:complete